MAVLRTRGARHVLVGFSLRRSDSTWSLQVSFPIFVQNVVDYLTLGGAGAQPEEELGAHAWGRVGMAARPGEPITVRVLPEVQELIVEGPEQVTVPAESGRTAVLPTLSRAGVYDVRGAAPPMDRIALSVLSDGESDLRGRRSVVVNAEAATAGAMGGTAPQELWPWLVGCGLALLIVEWLLFCRRASR